MKRTLTYISAALLILSLSLPALAAEVAQGKCVSFDKDKNIVTMEEFDTTKSAEHKYGKPTGKQLSFDLKDAMVGATPAPGDILRIAYTEGTDKDKKQAVRLMNVTKTDIMKR